MAMAKSATTTVYDQSESGSVKSFPRIVTSEELQKEIEENGENIGYSRVGESSRFIVVPMQLGFPKGITYKPYQQFSGAKERIVRTCEFWVDPFEPPKFMRERVPKASGSPPVPVVLSPPRTVTSKDQQDWKIPPCISLQDDVNALYGVGERRAREAASIRSKVLNEMVTKKKERKKQVLWVLAQKARDDYDYDCEREREERIQMEKIREECRRERERERRLEAKDTAMGKKSKITRDRDDDRDISERFERVALGMASTGREVMYDQRLSNQEKGTNSGFAADDQYNLYDKGGLFTPEATLSTLCRPKKHTDEEMYEKADEQLDTQEH